MANVSSSNGLEKRPKLRFPGFDEPWTDVHLFDVVDLRRKRARSVKEVYVSTENLLQDFEGVTPYQSDDEVEGIAFNTGDTLLANIRPYLKKAWYAAFDGTCSADVLAFSPKRISPAFLYNIIARDCFIEYVMSGVKGSKMPRGDKTHILEYEFAIPEKDEQEKIATFIALADCKIAKQRKMIAALKKYKRGVISALLSSKTNPYYSSETWKEVALCDVASGFEYGMNAAATVYYGSHKYIRITDIDDNSHLYSQDVPVSPEGQVDEKYRVRENDILFARTGASVGKSYRYQRSDGDLYYAGFLIRIHVNSDVNCDYVFQNTLTEAYRRWVLLESARSGQPGINAEQYKQYRFLLPPLELQNKISTLATNLDNLICKEGNLLSQIEQVKIALLQRLFI